MALCNQSTEEKTKEEVKEVEPSEADLKGSSSGSIAANCQATSQTAQGKTITGKSTRQVKQLPLEALVTKKFWLTPRRTPSKLTLKRQNPKKDHLSPAAPKKTQTWKMLPPARYNYKLPSTKGSDVTM